MKPLQICVMSDAKIEEETKLDKVMRWKDGTRRHYMNYEHFAGLFTPKRLELLEAIQDYPDENVTQLAKRLKRLPEAISRDVAFLANMELVTRPRDKAPLSARFKRGQARIQLVGPLFQPAPFKPL